MDTQGNGSGGNGPGVVDASVSAESEGGASIFHVAPPPGELTKKDIGAIRVFEMETLFQVAPDVAPKFASLVQERKKGGVRISPALDQSGESTRLLSRITP